jgi:hypothetical protein
MIRPLLEFPHRYSEHPEPGPQHGSDYEQIRRGEASSTGSPCLADLYDTLLECYLNVVISKELSDWLEELDLPFTGTVEEKLASLKQHADAITLPAQSFHRQTIFYLSGYSAETLSEICDELTLPSEGPAQVLFKRIYSEVGQREGWLQPIPQDIRRLLEDMFLPVIRSFDVQLSAAMSDLLRKFLTDNNPLPNSHLAYGRAFIVVLIPNLLKEAYATMLQQELRLSSRTA